MQSNERIGPYRLIEPLGSGGMGSVWRAWDERLKRPIALKRIKATAPEDRRLRERLRREAEAGARLNHPSIVHIYDIVETEESDWIVMELVEGRTLQAILKEGPLPPERVIRLGREIAEGLAEAHSQGFIHRDLKAPNVMVTRAGRAKILDFGVAKQIHPESQETTLSEPGLVIGTSYAMSPEQAMGLPLDARSDLFSLGSLLYEMVTGLAPFRAETSAATLARVCSFRQRPAAAVRPEVPRELSQLIDRLLEKDPVDRPASALQVAAALDQLTTSRSAVSTLVQISHVTSEASGEATVLELPSRPSPTLISMASEPTLFAGSTAVQESALPGPRSLRVAAGIAVLLLLALAAVYLLRSAVVEPTPHALYQQGLDYLDRFDRKGNLDLAIESFQKVLAQDETHAAAHAGLAKAYWLKHQGDSKDPMWLDRALPMAERAVALDPYLASAQVSLGLALNSAGRSEEALRHVERALVLDPANGDAQYAAGRIYESQRKWPEAEAAYKKAVEVEAHRVYLDDLGALYLSMGRTDEAIAAFRRSIELTPDGFRGYRNLGVAYYMKGNLAEAASQFQKALAIQPEASLYANLGTVQFALGFYQESADAYERALEMPAGSNDHVIWGNLGDACRWTPHKKERSREAYLRAAQLVQEQLRSTPGDPGLRGRLALYLAKPGDCTRASAELSDLEKVNGKDARSWFRMAVAYEVCTQREKALAALGQALRAGLPLDEVKNDPELLALRADPRYHRLIVGLSQES